MRLALFAVIVVAWPAAAVAQRDASPSSVAPAGTSTISGTVIAADSTAQPLRRAVVTLTGGPRARSVMTDDAGKFAFTSLSAGTYGVTARKAAYLAAPYGAKRPGRTGTSIVLAAGQTTAITISMFRGGAISGMLRDAAGVPLGGVDVRAIDVRVLNSTTDSGTAEMATTDDRGIYRFYGLLPGDYVLAALPSLSGSEIAAPTTEEIDARLAQLKTRGRWRHLRRARRHRARRHVSASRRSFSRARRMPRKPRAFTSTPAASSPAWTSKYGPCRSRPWTARSAATWPISRACR